MGEEKGRQREESGVLSACGLGKRKAMGRERGSQCLWARKKEDDGKRAGFSVPMGEEKGRQREESEVLSSRRRGKRKRREERAVLSTRRRGKRKVTGRERSSNRNDALAGMITGAVTVVIWKQLTDAEIIPFSLYEIVPGFLLATIAIIIFSLIGNHPGKLLKNNLMKLWIMM